MIFTRIGIAISLWCGIVATSQAAAPTVKLSTASYGYPHQLEFSIGVVFSEPVSGFDSSGVAIKNGVVSSIEGSKSAYRVTIKPSAPGAVNISVLANVATTDQGEANTASLPLTIMAINPSLNPSSNFNFSQWQLTLPTPIGGAGMAETVKNPLLSGDPKRNTGYTNSPYFYTNQNTGAIIYWTPANGATTPGTHYPRTEMLERLQGLTPTWTLSTYAHNSMTASLAVTETPATGRLVIGQIHDSGNTDSDGNAVLSDPLLKLVYDSRAITKDGRECNGCIYAEVRPTPATPENQQIVKTIVANVPLNMLFTYSVNLASTGELLVTLKGLTNKNTALPTVSKTFKYVLDVTANNTIGWGAQHLYFKAGSYPQANGPADESGGGVAIYYLKVQHS